MLHMKRCNLPDKETPMFRAAFSVIGCMQDFRDKSLSTVRPSRQIRLLSVRVLLDTWRLGNVYIFFSKCGTKDSFHS